MHPLEPMARSVDATPWLPPPPQTCTTDGVENVQVEKIMELSNCWKPKETPPFAGGHQSNTCDERYHSGRWLNPALF